MDFLNNSNMSVFLFLKKCLVRSLMITGLLGLLSCAPASNVSTGASNVSTGASNVSTSTGNINTISQLLSNQSWLIQLQREDGSPFAISDIGGYRVYFGSVSGIYTKEIEVASTAVPFRIDLTQAAKILLPGNYFVVVTVFDKKGRESPYSSEVKITV